MFLLWARARCGSIAAGLRIFEKSACNSSQRGFFCPLRYCILSSPVCLRAPQLGASSHLERFQEKCTRFSARKARQIKKLEYIQRLEDRRMCSNCAETTPQLAPLFRALTFRLAKSL